MRRGAVHRCPAPECGATVPHWQLMCRDHWRRVPGHLQREVYRAWKNGAGAGTAAHNKAMADAIASLSRPMRDGKMAAAGDK